MTEQKGLQPKGFRHFKALSMCGRRLKSKEEYQAALGKAQNQHNEREVYRLTAILATIGG